MSNENALPLAPKVWQKLRGARLGTLSLIAFGLAALYGTVLLVGLSAKWWGWDKVGLFGDAFGALTSLLNALAFAAVVATVVLQSQELEDNRRELAKQAEAQTAWAAAAREQIKLTRQLEAIRIRPVIKAEWEQSEAKATRLEFWIRNVGLGVAIVSHIEFQFSSDPKAISVNEHGNERASDAWGRAIDAALGNANIRTGLHLLQFDDLNRALAPGERQAFVRIAVEPNDRAAAFSTLRKLFRPVIHFKSVNGETRTSANQFDELRDRNLEQFFE